MKKTRQEIKFAYIRESSSKQVANGKNGLEAQAQDITSWLMRNNIDIASVKFITDAGRSGTSSERPGFKEIVNSVKDSTKNVSLIIAQTDDRIMRNVEETINFMKLIQQHKETKLVILNGMMDYSSADKIYITNSKAVTNQFWSDKTSEDTIDRMRAAASKGRYSLPGCPLGFIKDSKTKILTLDPDQFDALQELGQKMARNEYTIQSLLSYCSANKILNIKWTYEKLNALFTNPISNGTFFNRKQNYTIENHSPKLYDDELWAAIQTAKNRRKQNTVFYSFKNKVYCAKCGTLCSHACTVRPYKTYVYYVCETCETRINEEKFADILMPQLQEILKAESKMNFTEKLNSKIKKIDHMMTNADRDLFNEILTMQQYDDKTAKLKENKVQLQREIRDLSNLKTLSFKKLDQHSKVDFIRKTICKIVVDMKTLKINIEFKDKKCKKSDN